MSCCGAKGHSNWGRKNRSSNFVTIFEQRINHVKQLRLSFDTIGLLFDKFQTFSTVKKGREVCQESQFRDMIGSLG